MKRLRLLLCIVPFVLLACSPEVVEIANTAVPATSEPTAAPTDVPEPTAESETAVEEEPVVEEESSAETETEEVVASSETIFTIDTVASTLTWTGTKVGSSHTGTIDLIDGQLAVVDGVLQSASFNIDMTTIQEGSARLEQHLASDDFFGVETFPTASVEILEATPADSADSYNVRANLTIKGITNEITFPANASISGNTLTATADIIFDRSTWDVRYGSGSFFSDLGDDLINDEIEMTVELVGEG